MGWFAKIQVLRGYQKIFFQHSYFSFSMPIIFMIFFS